MKKVVLALVFAAALGIAWHIFTDGAMSLKAARDKLIAETQEAVVQRARPEDVAALALKSVNLTQGEHGLELWRLKAEWGNVRRSDNIMELEKPRFTYHMPPDGEDLAIASAKGEIDQKEQKVRFIDEVVATHADRTVTAPTMVYLGKTREIVCPQGAEITGPGLEGSANRAVWRLRDKVLEGFGNVDMTFENGNDVLAPRRDREDETRPRRDAQG